MTCSKASSLLDSLHACGAASEHKEVTMSLEQGDSCLMLHACCAVGAQEVQLPSVDIREFSPQPCHNCNLVR